MPALPLTTEQRADATRLKSLFAAWQKRRREAGQPSSQEALSDMLGFNQSALSQYLNGRIPLNVAAATKFAGLIECSIADFSPALAEEIASYRTAAEVPDSSHMLRKASMVSTDEDDQGEMIAVRRVNVRVEAGLPGFEADEEFEDGGVIYIPRSAIEREQWAPQCLMSIKVRGDSMLPVFANRDSIVINVADRKLVSGEVYAINFQGKPIVKQVVLEGHQWYMRSFNPKFDPVPFRSPDSDVIGKVVYQPGRIVSGRLE
jgi:phage repressor protein C with HTH and peptisase S24 domain